MATPKRERKRLRGVSAFALVVVFSALALSAGCCDRAGDELAQQHAIKEARKEGAQIARQNEQIAN